MCLNEAALADNNKKCKWDIFIFIAHAIFNSTQFPSIPFTAPGAKKEENNILQEEMVLCNKQTSC